MTAIIDKRRANIREKGVFLPAINGQYLSMETADKIS